MERRGFLGMLMGTAAASAGGLVLPKAVGAAKVELLTDSEELAEAMTEANESLLLVGDPRSVMEDVPEGSGRFAMYLRWRQQTSREIGRMRKTGFAEFLSDLNELNAKHGIPCPDNTFTMETGFGDF